MIRVCRPAIIFGFQRGPLTLFRGADESSMKGSSSFCFSPAPYRLSPTENAGFTASSESTVHGDCAHLQEFTSMFGQGVMDLDMQGLNGDDWRAWMLWMV